MNFPFVNGNSSNEKLMKKQLNYNINDKNITNKTSSFSHFLTSKKDNLYPSLTNNSLDNSLSKDYDNNIIFKSFKDNKVRYSIAKKNSDQNFTLKTKSKKKTSLRISFPSKTFYQIEALKHSEDFKTKIGLNIIKIKICDFGLAFLSLVSVLCVFFDNEYFIIKTFNYMEKNYGFKSEELNKKTNEEINLYVTLIENRKISFIENFFRYINVLSSFFCCVILCVKYYSRIYLLKIDKKLSENNSLFTSGLFHYFILECIICLISYPPKINKIFYFSTHTVRYIYSINSIILVFSFFKLYNIFKILLIGSQYSSRISEAICQTYKTNFNLLFMIKAEVNSRPIFISSIFFLIFILISTLLLRSFEVFGYDIILGLNGNKGKNDLRKKINNFWLCIITVTGIGYGDEYPRTNLGRIIIFFSSVFGIFFLGFLIASVSSASQFNTKEQRAYLKIKKILSKENLHHKSAELIKGILFLRKNGIIYKNKLGIPLILIKERIILFCKVYNDCRNFNDDLYVSRFYSIPIVNVIKTMECKLYDNLKSVTKHLDTIDSIDNDLLIIKNKQKKIVESLKHINFLQSKITKFLLENHNTNYLKRNEIIEVEEEDEESNKKEHMQIDNIFEIDKLEIFPDSSRFTKSILSRETSHKRHNFSMTKLNCKKYFDSQSLPQRKLNKFKNKFDLNKNNGITQNFQNNKPILRNMTHQYHTEFCKSMRIRRNRSFKSNKINLITNITMKNSEFKILPDSFRKKKNVKFSLKN